MARPISDEELQLKKRARRRLVGAIVLVSAVAVILPMVLDSEPKSVNKNVDIQIPPSDSAEFKPKTATPTPNVIDGSAPLTQTPAAAPPPEKGAATREAEMSTSKAGAPAVIDGAIGSKPTAGASSIAADESVPATIQPAREAVKPEPAEAKQSVSDNGKERTTPAIAQSKVSAKDVSVSANAYIVQVAALADAARAKKLQKQIAGAGVKTYTEVVSTKSGSITRVRAGPYSTREAAEKARTRLKKVGLDGKVVPK
jgi:DedD protein